MSKKNLLVITPSAFHNDIMHAGGKSIDFYFQNFYNDADFNTAILCLNDYDEDLAKMDAKFKNSLIIYPKGKKNIFRRVKDYLFINHIYSLLKTVAPLYYITSGFYKRRLIQLLTIAKANLHPDVIVVEYTAVIIFGNLIRSAFPNAVMVASCHDIVFQSIERKLKGHGITSFNNWYINSFKKLEKDALSYFNLITVPSYKDQQLLVKTFNFNPDNIQVITLYFDEHKLDGTVNKDGLLFFGYMRREENYLSVLHFLKHVWPLINAVHPSLQFYILGGGISEQVKSEISGYNNVVLTGFVANPSSYFSKAYAMVVPLLFGAGVKVKSLEALNSGLPLIANPVGIEGINAINKVHYLHSDLPAEWETAVSKLIANPQLSANLIANAKDLVNAEYSPTESYRKLKTKIITYLN